MFKSLISSLKSKVFGDAEERHEKAWFLRAVLLAGTLQRGEGVMVERKLDGSARFRKWGPEP